VDRSEVEQRSGRRDTGGPKAVPSCSAASG
jgi:hypothetical protein